MTTPSNSAILATCHRRLEALEKHAPKGKRAIHIDGRRVTFSQLRAVYERCLDTRAKVATLRAEIASMVVAIRDAERSRVEFDEGVRAWVACRFGSTSQAAHDFGFPPRRTAKKSVETKQHAIAQSKATRAARHTMGRRQRESLAGGDFRGDVAGAPIAADDSEQSLARSTRRLLARPPR